MIVIYLFLVKHRFLYLAVLISRLLFIAIVWLCSDISYNNSTGDNFKMGQYWNICYIMKKNLLYQMMIIPSIAL